MEYREMLKVCEKVEKKLNDERIYANVNPHSELPVIDVEIEWGDWKHEHLMAKWLVGEMGLHYISSQVTEENGSDCYSAVHHFYIDEVE